MQAAVARNTQALVQRNIAAGAVHMSKQPTPAAVVFSPCVRLVAWIKLHTLSIEDLYTGRTLSQPLLSSAMQNAICWSPDSSCCLLHCKNGVWAANPVFRGLTKVHSSSSTTNKCFWAPSAQIVAIVHICTPGSVLSLFRMPSRELLMEISERSCLRIFDERPYPSHVAWAANSRTLAMVGYKHIGLLDTTTQRLLKVPLPSTAHSLTAWSPCSWGGTNVLCFVCVHSVVHFTDCDATVKGRCTDPILGQDARHLLWGEPGVIIRTSRSLWLFHVHRRNGGLELEPRHTFVHYGLCRPVLSPDQTHLCMATLSTDYSTESWLRNSRCSIIILNVVSECRVLLRLPELVSGIPCCTFTCNGFSLAVSMTNNRDQDHLYMMLGFAR